MGFFVSPGVFPITKDISDIIPNLATTIGGLVGYSVKGATDELKLITNSQQFINEYGKPNPENGYFHYSALAFLEQGNKLYCLRVVNGALFGGVKIMSTGNGPNEALSVGVSEPVFEDESGANVLFNIFGKDPGVWNNKLKVVIENSDDTEKTFDIVVYQTDDDGVDRKVEVWTVSRQKKVDGFGDQLYLEDRINDFSQYIVVADNTAVANTVMPAEQSSLLALAGGSDGNAVTDSDLTNGWDNFTNPDNVDVRMLINGGNTSVVVQTKLKTIAEARRDCLAILDIPAAQLSSVADMVSWRNNTQNFNTSYTALYAPWVKINDAFNDRIISVPPSGYVGAQYAYNDYVGEPWFAPAGMNRGILQSILGLTNVFTQGERDTLYLAGINPLQTFRGEGNVIWGQKTQQKKASALDRVNVRRLLIVIEKSVSVQLRSFVFEPNNDLTRFRVTSLIEEFLTRIAARGAFQTELGDQGFRVICDETNNTPATIDANELHVDIFIKPTRAAEFIRLQTIITRTGASFEELISQGTLI